MIEKNGKILTFLFPKIVQKHQFGEVGNKIISSSRIFSGITIILPKNY